jgi:hypothetical protein
MNPNRVNIEYFDQNESFARLLPRTGVIVRKVKSTEDSSEWTHVRLDEPFDFQISPPLQIPVKVLHCTSLLIKPRWTGQNFGEDSKVHVFIRLVSDESQIKSDTIGVASLHNVAWGLCTAVEGGAT